MNSVSSSYEEFVINDNYSFIKTNLPQRKYPADLSYVLFTSGSTGFPKGIIHDAQSMFAFLKWCKREFTKYKIQKFVSIAPLNFDLSVFDIFFPLLVKKSLFLPEQSTISNPRLFVQCLVKNKVECIYTTPSYLKLLLQSAQLDKYNLSFVKLVLIAGEQLKYDLVTDLQKHFSKAVFYNLYGPTETNVCCYYKIDTTKINEGDINVPIGIPCYPNDIRINKTSELNYKGELLMKAMIDENGIYFVKRSSGYNTGDKVKRLKNGNFEFIGRGDNMIKRNGFRIELSEIRNALLEFEKVSNCEVIHTDKMNMSVVAFVESENEISELALRTFLLAKLPSYMLPDGILVMKKFPMSLNHKVDLQKLKENFI